MENNIDNYVEKYKQAYEELSDLQNVLELLEEEYETAHGYLTALIKRKKAKLNNIIQMPIAKVSAGEFIERLAFNLNIPTSDLEFKASPISLNLDTKVDKQEDLPKLIHNMGINIDLIVAPSSESEFAGNQISYNFMEGINDLQSDGRHLYEFMKLIDMGRQPATGRHQTSLEFNQDEALEITLNFTLEDVFDSSANVHNEELRSVVTQTILELENLTHTSNKTYIKK